MKRTGTPIRLLRIIRCVLFAAAVVSTACYATLASAAGDGTQGGWQSSSNSHRGQQPSRWTSTADRGDYEAPVSSTARSIRPTATYSAKQTTKQSARPSIQAAAPRKQSVAKKAQPAKSAATTGEPSRWLPPTQTTSQPAPRKTQAAAKPQRSARVANAAAQEPAATVPAREPKQFVPAADTRTLEAASARQNRQNGPISGAAQVASGAAQAAYKSVVPKPSTQGSPVSRARAQHARSPRVATHPHQRINTAWVQPLPAGQQPVQEEEIPMPYEGNPHENMSGPDVGGPEMGGGYEEGYQEGYADDPSMESYDGGGYDASYGDGYGGGCPCGPEGQCGPMCGEGCCDSMGGFQEDGMGGFCGDTCDPSCAYEPGCGAEPTCGCSEGGNCCDCFDMGMGVRDPEACEEVRFRVPKIQELTAFAGVHGFKGPLDRERDSGNFGFQEGFNAGAKVPLTKFGYQIGYQAVQSQLHGDKDTNISDPHTQQFLTVGVFRRNRNGWQLGAAYDILHEERWDAIDFEQVRGQVSFVECGRHEAGLQANVHTSSYRLFDNEEQDAFTTYQAADQYVLFYRLHGKQGGEGHVYAGVTDDSDAIVGADAFLPVQRFWSIQTGFTYLIPDQDGGTEGASQEAWNLSINLVWHWKGHARQCYSNPYRPLFDVADNGSLIVDDRP